MVALLRRRANRLPWYIVETMPQGMAALFLFIIIYGCGLAVLVGVSSSGQVDNLRFVDPLIGTIHGGHVFPGASLPYGMAKAVADVADENQGGFSSNFGSVTGFSHMHDSGTGGAASLGNFPIFPYSSCTGDQINSCEFSKLDRATKYVNGSVQARPGYFSIMLTSGIRAEMTVSNHTALYRFTFPSSLKEDGEDGEDSEDSEETEELNPVMIVEMSDLPHSMRGGDVSVDQETGRVTGTGTFGPSFGTGSYNLSFCADFTGSKLRDSGTWKYLNTTTEPKLRLGFSSGGAWVRFNKPLRNTLYARVGLSFISESQACRNAETEISDFDFRKVYDVAKQAWKDKFSVIQIQPGPLNSDELQTVFWSGIYRTMISPQDYTGENPLWKSDEPYYDSFYCIWDSFRSIHPFLTIIDPLSQGLMVRSLIDTYVHEGWLPDCRMSLCKGYTQGGSNADVVLVDSYIKGVSGPNWTLAYEAVVTDAEKEPQDWRVQGRGSLKSWKAVGYIPKSDPQSKGVGLPTRSISRTVEYAYNDYCIAQLALKLGNKADYDRYIERSNNWQNLFNAETRYVVNGTDSGFQGFLQPKLLNGSWAKQPVDLCSPLNDFDGCYLSSGGHETYEGSCWLYTFYVPGDMAALIAVLGGPTKFIERLDYLHESGLLYMGDEQAFLTVFLYHYAGRPGLSASRIHQYIPSQFNVSTAGIPGNDDSGAMGSFAAFSMMGIFPNAGQDVYLITPPFFKSVSVTNGQTGKVATIRNLNFDPTYKAIYIQHATLNGRPYTKSWIDHSFFLAGGVLELTLGITESEWGTSLADLPPSLSTS